MIKKIISLFIITAYIIPYAYAETATEISGEYSIAGTHLDKNDINYQYFEHELNLQAVISIEGTTLTTKAGIIDETWGDENNTGNADMELDRCWLTHVFPTGFKLEVGKMPGKQWGTMLGNGHDEAGYYRVKGTRVTGNTELIGYLQKNVEKGETAPLTKDSERDDADEASVGVIHKIGKISLMPKLTYTNDSSVDDSGTPAQTDKGEDGTQTFEAVFAVTGDVGSVLFETEMIYTDVSSDYPLEAEYALFTAWVDAKIDFNSVITGLSLAYGTEDDGIGLGSFGEDFSPMIIMDNDDGAISDLGAMFFARLYAEAEPLEGLRTGCAFAYGKYEKEAYAAVSDKTGLFEINITGDYAVTKSLKYSAGVAYADVDAHRDAIIQVEHELVFSF